MPFAYSADVFENNDPIKIKLVTNYSDYYEVGQLAIIEGSNFGTDPTKLSVILNEKSYKVETSHGNQLKFYLKEDMKSGQLYVTKKIEINKKRITKESNRYDLNLKEPYIYKIESKKGIKPDGELILYGKNLGEANFWCDDYELKPKKNQDNVVRDNKMIIILPNAYLNCSIEAIKLGFLNKTNKKITLTPSFKPYNIGLQTNFINLNSEGFFQYKEKLNKFKLLFEDNTTLSSAEFISDEQIRFKLNKVIPTRGNVSLLVEDLKLPPMSYDFDIDVAQVTDVTPAILRSNNEVEFNIQLSNPLNTLKNSSIRMNKKELEGTESGDILSVLLKTTPTGSQAFWVEKGNFKGSTYYHTFNTDYIPRINKATAVYKLNKSGGKLRVEGYNFYPTDSVKASSIKSNEIKISKLRFNSFNMNIPYGLEDGKYDISVSNKSGKSNTVKIKIPAMRSDSFYADPFIEEISFPYGPYVGNVMKIEGYGFNKVTSVNFGDYNAKLKSNSSKIITVKIPSKINLEGELTVQSLYKVNSKPIEYTVYKKPKNQNIEINYPLNNDISEMKINTEWQKLLSFSINNSLNVASVKIKWQVECKDKCIYLLPFNDYQLLDSDDKVIKNTKFIIDAYKKTISIDELENIPSPNNQNFTINVKMFKSIPDIEIRTMKIIQVDIRDSNKNLINKIFFDNKKSKTIYINANTETESFCSIINEKNKWDTCNILRKRPAYKTPPKKTAEKNSEVKKLAVSIKKLKEKLKPPQINTKKRAKFNDIKEEEWFFPYVKNLYQREIINGYSNGDFRPGNNLTKAELLKMVLVARGDEWSKADNITFKDTKDHWAKDLIEFSLEKEYIDKTKKFYPQKSVTRAETMEMLCKMFSIFENKEKETHFRDLKNNSAKNCIMSAYELGVIKGATSKTFKPSSLLTRAEFAKILSKVIEIYEE